MKAEYHITYLFISHDLRVVKHLSDRISVMYLGAMMEYAGKQSLFEHPLHPYTQMLLSSVPDTDPERKREKSSCRAKFPASTTSRRVAASARAAPMPRNAAARKSRHCAR